MFVQCNEINNMRDVLILNVMCYVMCNMGKEIPQKTIFRRIYMYMYSINSRQY